MALESDIELAVWRQLTQRRWFGKHVEDEEIESLEADMRTSIGEAVATARADVIAEVIAALREDGPSGFVEREAFSVAADFIERQFGGADA